MQSCPTLGQVDFTRAQINLRIMDTATLLSQFGSPLLQSLLQHSRQLLVLIPQKLPLLPSHFVLPVRAFKLQAIRFRGLGRHSVFPSSWEHLDI